ncbi:MAG: orotidine-5'-phosphate decarboxylase [Chthoniobacterales bacterium]|nr:orotidine-5'-phosphate decarboxylase [Chthoniobacterales bacterium]
MKLPSRPQDKIIIALDVPDTDGALRLIDSIADHGEPPALCKIGLELFTAEGPSVVKAVKARGCEIFLDLKFHDIPNTVAHAIRSAAGLGVAMTTIHAVGGLVMMEAAAKAAEKMELLILAVTVLTSMDSDQLSATGINVEPKEQVLRLAGIAAKAGIGGIVCSPLEISAIRESFDEKLRIVTPGVRPIWAAAGDQKRVMTPAEAVAAGSDWLVIGRPITAAENPKEAYAKVVAELS